MFVPSVGTWTFFEKYSIQVQFLGVLAWQLKDLCWVLLCWPLAWTAVVVAVCIEGAVLRAQWRNMAPAVRVHGLAVGLWIVGNGVWMTAELLFEPSVASEAGRVFPWFQGPLDGSNEGAYNTGVGLARFFMGVDLVMLATFYTACALGIVPEDQEHTPVGEEQFSEPLVFGCFSSEAYRGAFVTPWVLKDLFWTFDSLGPALCCAFVVIILVSDYLRRFGGLTYAAELFWVVGNTVWILAELQDQDAEHYPRLLAAWILAIGVIVTVLALFQSKHPADKVSEKQPIQVKQRA